ncbi:MAG: C10 family peptidase [Bacteroidota bacterium]
MVKKLCFGLILMLSGMAGFGKEVPVETAKVAGISFYYERINQFRPVALADIRVAGTCYQRVSGVTVYYIFNMEPSGYIAVSADDAVVPVLAYSFEGAYSRDTEPAQFTAWMKQYEEQISHARAEKLAATPPVASLWQKYSKTTELTDLSARRTMHNAVAPLIISNWDQGVPYNEQCPADAAGPGGHTLVGCVPVCLGQLMYYYRWPQTGTGAYSYTDPVYGVISADFGASVYDWNNMTNTSTISNPGIAKLLFHLGVSCDLVYGPTASGMYNHKAAYALRTFFSYSPQTQYVFRDSTNLNWDSILIAHLNRKMPLYYAGWSVPNINGHAFVCDGYQDTAYFHFNFGWSGQNNGYFYTNNLTPGGNNFKLAQEVIINAFPDTLHYTYPSYCAGETHLTTLSGSLTDGSGPVSNYQPSSGCSWLIDPQPANDSVSSITLTFNNINTKPADHVQVYDGASATAPLLADLSGDTVPQPITGTKNKMFLRFGSNGGAGAPGWFATYKVKIPVWCTGTTTIKADTAVVTDGSMGFDYHNNSICRWILQTNSGKPLTINFRRFDTEPGKDILSIYDLGNNVKLKEISGHYDSGNLPDTVTSPSGKMMLIFMTNASITGSGWEIFYPLTHLGTGEIQALQDLKIFPNPAGKEIEVQYFLQGAGRVNYRLSDMTGELLLNSSASGKTGNNHDRIDISSLAPGIYLLNIVSDQSTQTRKIVVR